MIQIYNPENENFEVNGDMTLLPIAARLEASLGEVWTYTLEHPIDGEGRWQSIVEGATIKAPSFNGEQLFTIRTTKKDERTIVAEADPIGMLAKDEVFIIDKRPTNKNGQQAINILTEGTRYSGRSDITKVATAYYQYVNLVEALNGGSNAFTQRWGGELIFDNLTFVINERAGGDYGVEVRYGFNIPARGFSEDIDTRSVVTRIYPKAYNGYTMTNNGYVDSPLIESYPTLHVATMKFENVRMAEDASETEDDVIICNNQEELDAALREQCELQYEAGIDKPIVSIKADMVMLNGIVGYEDYENLVTVGLGDTVHCKHSVLGITTDARVISLVYDSLLEKTVSVVLGDFEYNYFKKVGSLMQRVAGAIREDGSLVAEQVQGFIDGAFAQLRLQNTIAKKQDVRAILFEDLDPDSPTFGALAIGTQGWQISRERTTDGRDWVWTTAATSEGIIANVVVTGLLSDKLGRNYWNLDTGDFRLQSATIDGYATDSDLEDGLSDLQTAVNTAIQDLQDQIDGIVDTWYYSGEPALNKPPVTYDGSDPDTGWTTDADKRAHIGDIYYDTDTDYAYRFQYENNVFSWKKISDSDVTEALRLAREAQATADTKRRVFLTTPVPPYDVGDIYMQGANGDILVCVTAKTEGQSYAASDFAKRNKYVDGATVDNAITTYDNNLNQLKVFNKLTNNGALQGIYMENGQLYVNGSYIHSGAIDGDLITAGVLRDRAGLNYWNMVTGEFNLTGGTIGRNVTLEELDAIEVGGTQLLSQDLRRDQPTTYNFYQIPFFEPLQAGQEYTLQFWGVTLDANSSGMAVYWGGGSNRLLPGLFFPDENGYIKVTFTVTEAQTEHAQAANLWLNLYNMANGHTDSNATIEKWKLEIGNRATDWSLAPQDVEKYIGNAETSAGNAMTAANAAQSTADGNTQKLKAMYGTCTTAAGTAAKVVNATDFVLYSGATINVQFTYTNSAANPTLNVNGTGARPIYAYGSAITSTSNYWWTAGQLVQFTYNGSQWLMQVDNQTATFNKLTQGGTKQGITMDASGNLYINASYINSGYMSADRFQSNSIGVGKLTGRAGDTQNYIDFDTGTMNISSLNASVITAGTINAARIPNISAEKITTGTMSADRISGGSITTSSFVSSSGDTNNYKATIDGGKITLSGNGVRTMYLEGGGISFSAGGIVYGSYGLDGSSGYYRFSNSGAQIHSYSGTSSCSWDFSPNGYIPVSTGGYISPRVTGTETVYYQNGSSQTTTTWYYEYDKRTRWCDAYCLAYLSSTSSSQLKSISLPLPLPATSSTYYVFVTPEHYSNTDRVTDYTVRVSRINQASFSAYLRIASASSSSVRAMFHVRFMISSAVV